MNVLAKTSMRIVIVLLMLGLAIGAAVIGTFIVQFGVPSNFVLSSSYQDWSALGEYIGGLLGALFAFLAFVGVLFTVWLQARQLDLAANQAHLDELQRVMSNVSDNIDSILKQPPSRLPDHVRFRSEDLSVFSVISGGGTAALSNPQEWKLEYSRDELIETAKQAVGIQIGILGIELHQLTWCLEQYAATGGSKFVIDFYRKRFEAIVGWVDAMGYFKDYERIQKFFKPAELRPFLQPIHTA